MIRDLYNVRLQSVEGGSTPLTDDEEQRMRAMLFGELGNEIADRGWVRFPAYSPEDRHAADRRSAPPQLSMGHQVFVEAEDQCRLKLYLAGYGTRSADPTFRRPRTRSTGWTA